MEATGCSVIQFRYLLHNIDIDLLLDCLEFSTLHTILKLNCIGRGSLSISRFLLLDNEFSVARIALLFRHTIVRWYSLLNIKYI